LRHYKEEYYSVVDKRTGRKIVDCGEENEAWVMVGFDPVNRIVTKNQPLMGLVIDIQAQKVLPTSGITMARTGRGFVNIEMAKEKTLSAGTGEPVVL
jgi:hypothetical protein